jgi:hypothetical protein
MQKCRFLDLALHVCDEFVARACAEKLFSEHESGADCDQKRRQEPESNAAVVRRGNVPRIRTRYWPDQPIVGELQPVGAKPGLEADEVSVLQTFKNARRDFGLGHLQENRGASSHVRDQRVRHPPPQSDGRERPPPEKSGQPRPDRSRAGRGFRRRAAGKFDRLIVETAQADVDAPVLGQTFPGDDFFASSRRLPDVGADHLQLHRLDVFALDDILLIAVTDFGTWKNIRRTKPWSRAAHLCLGFRRESWAVT